LNVGLTFVVVKKYIFVYLIRSFLLQIDFSYIKNFYNFSE